MELTENIQDTSCQTDQLDAFGQVNDTLKEDVLCEKKIKAIKREIADIFQKKRNYFLYKISQKERNKEDAEEILATSMYNALKYGPRQFRGESSLSSYIESIVYNDTCAHIRKSIARKDTGIYYENEISADSIVETESQDDQTSLESMIDGKQAIIKLNEAVDQLEAQYPKTVLVWKKHYIEGLDYTQISEALDLPEPTVRGHIFRMKKYLARTPQLKDVIDDFS